MLEDSNAKKLWCQRFEKKSCSGAQIVSNWHEKSSVSKINPNSESSTIKKRNTTMSFKKHGRLLSIGSRFNDDIYSETISGTVWQLFTDHVQTKVILGNEQLYHLRGPLRNALELALEEATWGNGRDDEASGNSSPDTIPNWWLGSNSQDGTGSNSSQPVHRATRNCRYMATTTSERERRFGSPGELAGIWCTSVNSLQQCKL